MFSQISREQKGVFFNDVATTLAIEEIPGELILGLVSIWFHPLLGQWSKKGKCQVELMTICQVTTVFCSGKIPAYSADL